MKNVKLINLKFRSYRLVLGFIFGLGSFHFAQAQEATVAAKPELVKYTFESTHIGDNQTIHTLYKNSVEMVIQHRFGVVNNGYKDFYGIFAPSNIRLGFAYGITKNITAGFGICKDKMTWDGNIKIALLKQATKGMPISMSYFGNMAIDTRSSADVKTIVTNADRFSYFSQLLIAMKVNKSISFQVAPSITHLNNVEGYLENNQVKPYLKSDHIAIACMGRYKLTNTMSVIANYDQALTVHPKNNPYPNVSGGFEMSTGSHTFQIFAGNYSNIVQGNNNYYNMNDFANGQFLIGFNITRRWDFE